MTHPSVNSIVERLTRIADASRRADGSDIPLGEQCREAATIISDLQAERDNMQDSLLESHDAQVIINLKSKAAALEARALTAESFLSRIKEETIEARKALEPFANASMACGALELCTITVSRRAVLRAKAAIRSLGSTGGGDSKEGSASAKERD